MLHYAETVVEQAPATWIVLGSAGIAATLTLAVWGFVGHAITIAHEGGHALSGAVLGRGVESVRLNRDRTGETITRSGSIMSIPITLAGYTGPSAFGLLGAMVLTHGRADVVLWVSIMLLAGMLIVTRNLFGNFTVLITGAVLFLAAYRGSAQTQLLVACTWVWLLLIGGLVHVLQHGSQGGDHASLRQRTFIPRSFWALLFGVVAFAALAEGGMILLRLAESPI